MRLGPAAALLSASNCLIIAVAALAERLSLNFVPVPSIFCFTEFAETEALAPILPGPPTFQILPKTMAVI